MIIYIFFQVIKLFETNQRFNNMRYNKEVYSNKKMT